MISEWPDWIPGYSSRADPNHSRQRRPPQGIVVHSGEEGPDLVHAALTMPISYHFAWEPQGGGHFVQLVSLQRRAYHAGPEGNDWIGIALSGPWDQQPRAEREREQFQRLVSDLLEAFGGALLWYCRHSDITPGKRDPGPGFTPAWIGHALEWKRGPGG